MSETAPDHIDQPAVSVLLPVRDAQNSLRECLDSIAAQTLRNHEVLVIDDHSSDSSAQILAEYGANDARIRVTAARGKGLVAALNQGLALCRSDIVARMDSDDVMYPQRLAAQFTAMRTDPTITVLGCRVRLLCDEPAQTGFVEYLRWQNSCRDAATIAANIYVESPFAHPSVAFRRERIIEAGGYREGDFAEDYDLWLRLAQAGDKMTKLDTVLLDWRDHPERLSRRDPRCARSAFDRLRGSYLARDPRVVAAAARLWIWGAGRKTRGRSQHLLAHGFAPRAYIDIDPKKIGNRIGGIDVCSPAALDSALSAKQQPFVLSYVTNHGAREQISDLLEKLGLRLGEDYLCVG